MEDSILAEEKETGRSCDRSAAVTYRRLQADGSNMTRRILICVVL